MMHGGKTMTRKYPFIICIAIMIISFGNLFAAHEIQTSWTGGPGTEGPVLSWGNRFYTSDYLSWYDQAGTLLLELVCEDHLVEDDFDGAYSVCCEDMDSDGDLDVLGAASIDSALIWWENNGTGSGWSEHVIVNDFEGAISVCSGDFDGDGDPDVLGAAAYIDEVVWWENADGSGTKWIEHVIADDFDFARCVHSADIDGDGDLDVLAAAFYGDDITWWSNEGGLGTVWKKHMIDGDFNGAISVHSADIDGDGDMDVLGAAGFDDDITWWENTNGSGTSWSHHTICDDFNYPRCVYSADLDGDRDVDVLGAAGFDDDITWWENTNGSGTSWTEHTIDDNFDGANAVCAGDLDGDGDMDVIGAAYLEDCITWWDNEGGSGTSWVVHTIQGGFDGAVSVCCGNLDNDGGLDVVGASIGGDDIIWWSLNGYAAEGQLVSSILDTETRPDWNYFDWSALTPAGTSVLFQLRASADYSSMGAWSDTLERPCLLANVLDDGTRFVQYRALMSSSDPEVTPVLNDLMIVWDPEGVEESTEPVPPGIALFPIAPNPAVGAPVLRFSLPETREVELLLFDLTGRLIVEYSSEVYTAGLQQVQLNDLSPGIYFCRMISADFTDTQRFVVIE